MKRIRKYKLLLITVLAGYFPVAAQLSDLDTLKRKFDSYRHQSVQEKLYVHVDRHQYITGETMWFRIYAVDGTLHKPLDLSKVCYVEIIDNANDALAQVKVKMSKGGGDGFLFIPATINSGNYTLRAYTNWMKNFAPDFFFHTTISIVNPFRIPDQELQSQAKQPDAQFFPEGGNLVAGIKSKVAYRVVNNSGNGIVFSGSILGQRNDTIASFKPLKNGIGTFYFTPQAGEKYKAVIRDQQGQNFTYPLPVTQSEGYTMELSGEQIHVRTNLSGANHFYLFVHTRQIIAQAEVRLFNQGTATVPLKTSQLPDGITHITIFDEKLNPVCERLYFKKPAQKLDLKITPDQTTYGLRQKVNLALDLSTANAGAADLSVAVYRMDSLSAPPHQSIGSYLWLSADLKGQVETPEYYLTSDDSLVQEATDNLMLTHGWRRFTWKNVLDRNQSPAFIPEYRGHIVNVVVKDQAGLPAPGIQTFLSAPGKMIRLYGSRSTNSGRASIETLNFYGSQKIVLQTNRLRDSVYVPEVINPFSDQFANRPEEPFLLSFHQENALLTKTISMQVQDIYHDDRSSAAVSPVKDSTAFYGKADETYLLDAFTRFPVMEEIMREYVPGVLVRKRRNGFHFLVIDSPRKRLLQDDPMILLDGVPIFDADEIMAFDPLKVKKLEVLTRQYHLGTMIFQGVVSYSTYKGDLGGFQLNPKAVVLNYEGLQINREFYTPLYEDKKQRAQRVPDQRSLLFWAPVVKIQAGKKVQLSFYTSDLEGMYTIVVEGNSAHGVSGNSSASFQAKRFDN